MSDLNISKDQRKKASAILQSEDWVSKVHLKVHHVRKGGAQPLIHFFLSYDKLGVLHYRIESPQHISGNSKQCWNCFSDLNVLK